MSSFANPLMNLGLLNQLKGAPPSLGTPAGLGPPATAGIAPGPLPQAPGGAINPLPGMNAAAGPLPPNFQGLDLRSGNAPNINSIGALSNATGGQMGGVSAPPLPDPTAASGIAQNLPTNSTMRMAPQNYLPTSGGPSGMQQVGSDVQKLAAGAKAAAAAQPQFGSAPSLPGIQTPQSQVVTGNQNAGQGWAALMQQMMPGRR